MAIMAEMAADAALLVATPYRVVDLGDSARVDGAMAWWQEVTGAGGEGMVVKPYDFAVRGKRGLPLREFALGIEALERFVKAEPPRRVHECVFAALVLGGRADRSALVGLAPYAAQTVPPPTSPMPTNKKGLAVSN